jgi:hypothetical protein
MGENDLQCMAISSPMKSIHLSAITTSGRVCSSSLMLIWELPIVMGYDV